MLPVSDQDYKLAFLDGAVCLVDAGKPKSAPVMVDFTSGAIAYRRKFAGGSQAIARAAGVKGPHAPSVVDATAGMGRDAFVLASLGCRVHMIERHPLVARLLEDGLLRACRDADIGHWVAGRMSLQIADSREALKALPFVPDVIYLDPMFPVRRKSALVKKDMQAFHRLVGPDEDSAEIFKEALRIAVKRVVVKRPSGAPSLTDLRPDCAIKTKLSRFDIYLKPGHGARVTCR